MLPFGPSFLAPFLRAVYELEEDHRSGISAARSELQDASISTWTLRVTRRQIGEQFLDGVLITVKALTTHERCYLTTRVQVAAFRERNQLLGDGANFLRFRFGRLNALVQEQVGHQITEKCFPSAGIATQFLISHLFSLPCDVAIARHLMRLNVNDAIPRSEGPGPALRASLELPRGICGPGCGPSSYPLRFS